MPAKPVVSATPAAVTPPAPVPAGLMIRLMAMVYDGLLLLALWFIVTAILVLLGTPEKAARAHEVGTVSQSYSQFVVFPALVVITWLFYGYFWVRAGQTLGMQTWRLQVLRADGSHLRWSDALTRCASACLFPIVCGLISQIAWHSVAGFVLSVMLGFLVNYLWLLWSRQGLCWHDQMSGTRVWKLPPEPKKKRAFFGWFAEKED